MPTSPEIISSTQNREYSITRLSRDNLGDLAILHSNLYGMARPADYYLKKYDTGYTRVENVGFIAYTKENLPVACYGVIPCFIQFGNEMILAAQSADAMTDPRYRHKGIFARLSGLTFDLCRELGIRLTFGFPNQDFYKVAINKQGWRTTETMDCFSIPVATVPLDSFFRKAGVFKKVYRKYCASVLKKMMLPLNGVPNSVQADGFAGVCRSDEYLYYKTYNASKVIRIGDVKVWISNRNGLVIGDMEGFNETNFKAVINKLEKIARRSGIQRIQFHSSPGTSLHRLFALNYTSRPSFHVLFQDLGSVIPPEKIKFTFADIDIF